jgi:glycosyltransferase involved in cell wall biosynthesis
MLEASVIVPTKNRPHYLRAALDSLAAQDLGSRAYELLVVDDGPSTETRDVTRAVARRTGTRIAYVEREGAPGLNSARNTGIVAAEASFIAFVDDDVEAPSHWLRELVEGRRQHPGYQAFGGPIRLRLEGSRLRMCGRESPPITTLDAGLRDREVELVWGANMAIDRGALDLAGMFDPSVPYGFDEDMWERRLRAAGGRIMYVARAGLVHRRDRRDARLASLVRESYRRGVNLRAYSEYAGHAPSHSRELRVLAGCVFHTFRYRCGNGILLTAHSAGRLRRALARR